MAKQVTIRRGTTAEHSDFAGAEGEITVDTTKDTVVVHDGSTAGGFPLALESAALSDAEIKIAYEANANTNEFSDAEQSKLSGVETSATADQSDAEIKIAYENNANTNEFSDAEQSKLSGVETSADVTDDANVRAALAGATADISVNSHKIIGVTDPTADQDAATKAYVDSIANGLATKDAVRVATTTNITLSGLQTIDGVVLVATDRVLVKNQTNATQNGIYDVAAGAWSRSTDSDNTPGGELGPGTFTFVEEGTTQADNGYVATGIATGSGALTGYFDLGTDNITFSQFSGAGQITAGTNLNKSGNTINLDTTLTNFASTGIDDNASSIAITIDSSENVGIGIASPDGTLHVHTASAGAVTAIATADDLVVESSSHVGISLLSTDIDSSRIVFGTPGDSEGANIVWNNSLTFMVIGTKTTGGRLSIAVDDGIEAVRITAAGDVGIGTAEPLALLHVKDDIVQSPTVGGLGVRSIIHIKSVGASSLTNIVKFTGISWNSVALEITIRYEDNLNKNFNQFQKTTWLGFSTSVGDFVEKSSIQNVYNRDPGATGNGIGISISSTVLNIGYTNNRANAGAVTIKIDLFADTANMTITKL